VNAWLNSTLARIVDGTLVPPAYYRGLDCDAALDARDSDTAFDSEWAWHSEKVEQRWAAAEFPAEARTLVEDIRRQSFLTVSRATGQHEIASYVSDDFALIVRGRLVGAQNSFLEQLWEVYERGEFPQPPL
jgi:hypothetical protein